MTTVTLPRELVEFLNGAGPLDGVWFGEKHANKKGAFWWREYFRAALDAPATAPDMVDENDRAVGKKWREDSRLEEWFPITAEKLSALEVEVHKLRMRQSCGEVVAWRRWSNKWHEYEYARNPQVDAGSLVGWEPLAVVLALLDAPANHPCQMCKHYAPGDESNDGICLTSNCTDFDRFQALPPIVLTKVTK